MKKDRVRVLVIEDDPLVAEIITAIIRPLCDEVQIADTMERAMSLLAIQCYDAALLDLTLPDSTLERSLASVETIKRMGAKKVVIITASPIDDRLLNLATKAGADETIGKDVLDFEKRVRAVILRDSR